MAKWRRRTSVSCRGTQNQTIKDRRSLRYTAKPNLRHNSDQSRLDPEPGRTPTPRLGLDHLSRNTQNNRIRTLVNENLQIFVNPSREHLPRRVGFGALAEIVPGSARFLRVGLGVLVETDFAALCRCKRHNAISLSFLTPGVLSALSYPTLSFFSGLLITYLTLREGGRLP
jgi:hypothetical protein